MVATTKPKPCNIHVHIHIHTLYWQKLVASVLLLAIWLLVKIRVAPPSWNHSTVVVVWFCWLFLHQLQRMSSRRPRRFLVYWHARVRWYWVPVAATQILSGARRMVWRITAPPANAGGGTGGATGAGAVAGGGTGGATGGGACALDRPSQSWRRAAKPRSAKMTSKLVKRLDAPGMHSSRSMATNMACWATTGAAWRCEAAWDWAEMATDTGSDMEYHANGIGHVSQF